MAINLGKGSAKGVPLEELKKTIYLNGFLNKTYLFGASAILRKSAPAASWGIVFSAVQGAASFSRKEAKVC